jgi:glucose-6-phosphate 1-dehydrogenase
MQTSPRNSKTSFAPKRRARSINAEHALDPQLWAQLAKGISYVQGDFLDDGTYADIASKIADSGTGNAVFYLATAPRFFSEVVQRLGRQRVAQGNPGRLSPGGH